MRDKVVLGVTLSVILLLTLAVYGVIDTNRGSATVERDRQLAVREGKHIYAQYCIQCHGPVGEGCIGPALARDDWRPVINGEPNLDFDEASSELIYKTLERGRASNQPGVQMPGWSVREGTGPLTDQELEELVLFIQYGEWAEVLDDAASAVNLAEPLPAYPGFTDEERIAEVKQVMLEKGCLTCHQIGKGGGQIAAILTDVGSRRNADWLRRWIKDPKSVPDNERGPNLWLIGPTATVPPPPGVTATVVAQPTAQQYAMNETYMPTIPMTDEELELMVDYLSKARATP
jgi:mono/diheme cytochrome c family protein